ncbi:group II intron maturase-specific domain-containing protein [Coraliomargarita algicola]|uniref:group II intron maturase-specific domain-containing protein n=1 Tax=Coraliomargarita algicola TaxID=3092156 RepID=UPI003CE5A19C
MPQYIRGWMGYFGLSVVSSVFHETRIVHGQSKQSISPAPREWNVKILRIIVLKQTA